MSKDNSAGNKDFLMLSRRFLQNELWNERRVFSKAEAWIDILFTVQYGEDPFPVPFGYKKLICYRGQALKSIETWAKRWNWSKSKVVRFFGMLKNRKMIRTESETQTTRLIVCNYEAYNKPRNTNGTTTETQTERTRNARGTHAETVEEGNKDKKENKDKNKEEKTTTPKLSLTETQLELIELLKSKILENNPGARISSAYENVWGKELEKMMRLDRRSADQIRTALLWSQASDFWCSNILSFGKLRQKFDMLTLQIKRGKGGDHVYSGSIDYNAGFAADMDYIGSPAWEAEQAANPPPAPFPGPAPRPLAPPKPQYETTGGRDER